MSDYPDYPLIDVWAVLADPDVPRDVGQRLLSRQRARAEGLVPEVVPEGDKPFLARHIVPSASPDTREAPEPLSPDASGGVRNNSERSGTEANTDA